SDGTRSKQANTLQEKAFLGLRVDTNASSGGGAPIVAVVPGSPAEKAGAMPGDIVIEMNGEQVGSPETLRDRLDSAHPGDAVSLRLRRGSTEMSVQAHLTSRDKFADASSLTIAGSSSAQASSVASVPPTAPLRINLSYADTPISTILD